jgi:proteasome lid subunit RPN8/RPN11
MKWTSIKSKIATITLEKAAINWCPIDLDSLESGAQNYPLILYPDAIRKKIMKHVQGQNVELGGLLVGSIVGYGDSVEEIIAIVVRDAIPSLDYESTAVSLTMSPKVWQSANSRLSAEMLVIGWYHSHPNLGAFFSCVDKKTQKDFFSKNYNLGLVIDPVREEEKWYIGAEAHEIAESQVRVFGFGICPD